LLNVFSNGGKKIRLGSKAKMKGKGNLQILFRHDVAQVLITGSAWTQFAALVFFFLDIIFYGVMTRHEIIVC
jgi:hypothetical protein